MCNLVNVEDVTVEYFINNGFLLKADTARRSISDILKGSVPGIYCFLDKNGVPLYLGKSIRLNERIRSHFSGHSTPTKQILEAIRFVKILPIKCRDHRLYMLEKRLIEGIKPLFNGSAQGTEVNYGYRNLRDWFNAVIKTSKIISEEVLQNRIITFIHKERGKVEIVPVDNISVPGDNPLVEVRIKQLREIIELERMYDQGEVSSEEVSEKSVDTYVCERGVIREAIKMLISNCPPSKELDDIIDGLINASK